MTAEILPGDGRRPVLVTGAAGFIGGAVVNLLAARGRPVRALVRPGEAVHHLPRSGVEIRRGDLLEEATVREAPVGADAVVHCAARTGPWGVRAEYEAVNVRALQTLLDASIAAGVRRFVHVSSAIVMGSDVAGAADETAPLSIEPNPYSWSKVLGERLLERAVRDRGAPVTIVRPGLLYGPRDAGGFARFAALLEQRKMVVIGRGDNHLPLAYVDDVAEGIVLAADAENAVGRAYILVNDEPVTQLEYLAAVAAQLRVPPPRIRVPYRLALLLGAAGEGVFGALRSRRAPPLTRFGVRLLGGENRLSIRRAREELGFRPGVDLAEGVRRSVRWYRDRKADGGAAA